MSVTNRRKHREKSSTFSPASSHKLFADYPYPIINELNKTYKQKESFDHSAYALASSRWYTNSFHKMFDILHNLRSVNLETSIIEQSFKQAQIDGSGSKSIVNNLQKKTKPTRIKRIFASPMTPPIHEHEEQNNKRHVRKIKTIN
jgi:hypothetical protein